VSLDEILNGKAYSGNRIDTVAPKIRCADGFTLSVQASWAHYCLDSRSRRPDFQRGVEIGDRNGDAALPYTAVEVGYPSARPEPWHCSAWSEGYDNHDDHEVCDGWQRYAEDPSDDTGSSIYAFVPVSMVHALIAAHGGESR